MCYSVIQCPSPIVSNADIQLVENDMGYIAVVRCWTGNVMSDGTRLRSLVCTSNKAWHIDSLSCARKCDCVIVRLLHFSGWKGRMFSVHYATYSYGLLVRWNNIIFLYFWIWFVSQKDKYDAEGTNFVSLFPVQQTQEVTQCKPKRDPWKNFQPRPTVSFGQPMTTEPRSLDWIRYKNVLAWFFN